MCRSIALIIILLAALLVGCPTDGSSQQSAARQWNEILLAAIRVVFARPTVHARNLFHTSVAMYDAWAAYDPAARPFLLGHTVGGYTCAFDGFSAPSDVEQARQEAISYAAYRLLSHRFQASPGVELSQDRFDRQLARLGYDPAMTSTDYASGSPAALGNYIAQGLIEFGLQDGANEANGYANRAYEPANPPLIPKFPGNPDIVDLNHWQPLTLQVFIDQAGNLIPGNTPSFLSPE